MKKSKLIIICLIIFIVVIGVYTIYLHNNKSNNKRMVYYNYLNENETESCENQEIDSVPILEYLDEQLKNNIITKEQYDAELKRVKRLAEYNGNDINDISKPIFKCIK